MKKLIKIFAGLLGSIVALLVVAGIVITLYFDPNDYRDEISDKVKENTGRELNIEGAIKLSLFPWIGIELGKMELGNAAGFGPEPFARLGQADVKVKLLPLLRRELEMDTITLRGLSLSLGRNAEGVSNWDDLVKKGEEKPVAEAEKAPAERPTDILAALAIGGVVIDDAQIIWDDRTTGKRMELSQFNFTSGALSLDTDFPVEMDFAVDISDPKLDGRIHFAAMLGLDINGQRYRLSDARLNTKLASPLFPSGRLDADIDTEVTADLSQQTAEVKNLQLLTYGSRLVASASASRILADPTAKGHLSLKVEDPKTVASDLAKMLPEAFGAKAFEGAAMDVDYDVDIATQQLKLVNLNLNALGIALTGLVKGQKIIDAPSFSGHLESSAFVPRDVVSTIGVTLPETVDPSVFTKAMLATDFMVGLDNVALDKLRLQFDQSTLTGKASVTNFAKPVIRYDLVMDSIDADRYLPPPSEKGKSVPPQAATPAAAAAAGAAQLPLELLRSLDIEGTARLGKLKIMNLHSTEMRATLNARKGLYKLYPLSAKLYQGSYQGNLRFDVRQDTPRIGVDEKLAGVQAGPLLKDFMGKDYVTGKANLSATMTAQGLDDKAIRKSLNGTAAFNFQDGAVNGINVAQLIRNAFAAYKRQPLPKDEVKKTDFAILQGSVTVKNGLATNKDLVAKSPLFRVNGAGSADLVSEKIDYLVKAAIVGTLEGQGGKEITELKDVTVPIRIKGTFTDPKFNVELEALLEAKAKAEIEKKKKEIEEKARQRIEEEKKELKKELEKELGDKLKDMFKF